MNYFKFKNFLIFFWKLNYKSKIIHIIFFLSLLFLFINTFYLLKINNKLFFKKAIFKNINDFFINNNIFNVTKKKITLYFIDYKHYSKTSTIELLKNKYDIKISKNNPDYLIYDVFGCNHINYKYNNSIKIAIYTENQIPDFNEADYGVSHSHINFLDRNFKYPYYFFGILKSINEKNFNRIRNKLLNVPKKKFCAAVIKNYWFTDYFRLNFINELNKYKKIDMGGKYKNNIGKIIKKDKITKIKFFSSYKFSIAMENTEGDGYVSEKIIESFLSGTIPIYYGDYMIDEFLNLKSFILLRGEKDIIKKINYIKEIDNNNSLYKSILSEKILIDENILKKSEDEYKFFLYHIFEQDKNKAKRIDKTIYK